MVIHNDNQQLVCFGKALTDQLRYQGGLTFVTPLLSLAFDLHRPSLFFLLFIYKSLQWSWIMLRWNFVSTLSRGQEKFEPSPNQIKRKNSWSRGLTRARRLSLEWDWCGTTRRLSAEHSLRRAIIYTHVHTHKKTLTDIMETVGQWQPAVFCWCLSRKSEHFFSFFNIHLHFRHNYPFDKWSRQWFHSNAVLAPMVQLIEKGWLAVERAHHTIATMFAFWNSQLLALLIPKWKEMYFSFVLPISFFLSNASVTNHCVWTQTRIRHLRSLSRMRLQSILPVSGPQQGLLRKFLWKRSYWTGPRWPAFAIARTEMVLNKQTDRPLWDNNHTVNRFFMSENLI